MAGSGQREQRDNPRMHANGCAHLHASIYSVHQQTHVQCCSCMHTFTQMFVRLKWGASSSSSSHCSFLSLVWPRRGVYRVNVKWQTQPDCTLSFQPTHHEASQGPLSLNYFSHFKIVAAHFQLLPSPLRVSNEICTAQRLNTDFSFFFKQCSVLNLPHA